MNVEFHYEELKKMFGDTLPDYNHYPLQFAYFVKLYAFYLKRESKVKDLVPTND